MLFIHFPILTLISFNMPILTIVFPYCIFIYFTNTKTYLNLKVFNLSRLVVHTCSIRGSLTSMIKKRNKE